MATTPPRSDSACSEVRLLVDGADDAVDIGSGGEVGGSAFVRRQRVGRARAEWHALRTLGHGAAAPQFIVALLACRVDVTARACSYVLEHCARGDLTHVADAWSRACRSSAADTADGVEGGAPAAPSAAAAARPVVPERAVAYYGRCVAEALGAVHGAGLVYRDLKVGFGLE